MNKEALGESTEATEDRDILLGSYIFLRYYSPAIITPEEYGILPMSTPSYQSRRNLLHVTTTPSQPSHFTLLIGYYYHIDCQGHPKPGQSLPIWREGTLDGSDEQIPQSE